MPNRSRTWERSWLALGIERATLSQLQVRAETLPDDLERRAASARRLQTIYSGLLRGCIFSAEARGDTYRLGLPWREIAGLALKQLQRI